MSIFPIHFSINLFIFFRNLNRQNGSDQKKKSTKRLVLSLLPTVLFFLIINKLRVTVHEILILYPNLIVLAYGAI